MSQIENEKEFHISAMSEDDLREVMAIEMELFSQPWAPLAFLSEIQYNPQAHYLVLRQGSKGDGELIAYLGWWQQAEEAFITKIAVRKDKQRQGFGRLFIKYLKEQAEEKSIKTLALEVRENNTSAIAFYSGLGFSKCGILHKYYENTEEDAIVLSISL